MHFPQELSTDSFSTDQTKKSSKESSQRKEQNTSTWNSLLNTIQLDVEALQYQSEKMEIQLTLLNILAVFTAGIDEKLGNLNGLITRVQANTHFSCKCDQVVDKLSTLPSMLSGLIKDIKSVTTGNIIKDQGTSNSMEGTINGQPIRIV